MKKNGIINLSLIVVLLVGVSLLLYPSLSDYYNSFHQSRAIATYTEDVSVLDKDKYADLWQAAIGYNASLLQRDNSYILSEEQKLEYETLLDLSDNGIMGSVEIPSIGCSLPIYHGTEASALQIAVGHLEWTSLPVGGESTHCVLSGHRGLPSAKLFSDLDKLSEGDTFMLRVLNEILTYEVDLISIVLPHETASLHISEGEDYCTLMTCTPYGVNSHRLLVRGHRVENSAEESIARVSADAVMIEPLIVAPIAAVPILILGFAVVMMTDVLYTKKFGGNLYEDD